MGLSASRAIGREESPPSTPRSIIASARQIPPQQSPGRQKPARQSQELSPLPDYDDREEDQATIQALRAELKTCYARIEDQEDLIKLLREGHVKDQEEFEWLDTQIAWHKRTHEAWLRARADQGPFSVGSPRGLPVKTPNWKAAPGPYRTIHRASPDPEAPRPPKRRDSHPDYQARLHTPERRRAISSELQTPIEDPRARFDRHPFRSEDPEWDAQGYDLTRDPIDDPRRFKDQARIQAPVQAPVLAKMTYDIGEMVQPFGGLGLGIHLASRRDDAGKDLKDYEEEVAEQGSRKRRSSKASIDESPAKRQRMAEDFLAGFSPPGARREDRPQRQSTPARPSFSPITPPPRASPWRAHRPPTPWPRPGPALAPPAPEPRVTRRAAREQGMHLPDVFAAQQAQDIMARPARRA